MTGRPGLRSRLLDLTRRHARRRDERGYAAVLLAVVVASGFIFAMAAVSIDTSRWYDEQARVQKAADVAALAGVPFLPHDPQAAFARAREVAARNGYDDASSSITVTPRLGGLPSELEVEIASTIPNTFGAFIGVSQATVARHAKASYNGPAPMGSPCNTYGNEPDAGNGASSPTPTGTAQGISPYTNCLRRPQYWINVEGPETGKLQGDRYQTRGCEANGAGAPSSGVDGCSGSGWGVNDEYDPFGYVFTVKVLPGAVGQAVDLQLFDPLFIPVGQRCDGSPLQSANLWLNNTADFNPYVKNNDARNRYSTNSGNAGFCPGDSYAGAGSGANPRRPVVTSFVLRQQVDSQDPTRAPVQNSSSGTPCIAQYGSYTGSWSNMAVVNGSSSSYIDDVAKTFHNWVSFCRFVPPRAGDYYLQVRTNVAMGGSGTSYIRTGNAAALAAAGNTTQGEGSNAFSVRAVMPAGIEQQVAVSGFRNMPIFVNADTAAPIFNLIRVLPGAAGQKLAFSYFDAGDAAGDGYVQVLTPTDASGSITHTPFPGGCKAVGGSAGTTPVTYADCRAPFTRSGGYSRNNGKTEIITIPIPSDYTCNYSSFSGCWYRVQITFGSGTVNDVTTWNAEIVGDPLRLVE